MIPTIIALLILFFCAVWCILVMANANARLTKEIYKEKAERYVAERCRSKIASAYIAETDSAYHVWLYDDGVELLIRNFDKADDAKCAQVRAEELCDTLNSDF